MQRREGDGRDQGGNQTAEKKVEETQPSGRRQLCKVPRFTTFG